MSNFENAKKYSEFARLSYIIASDTITNENRTIIFNGLKYQYITATSNLTDDGFQAMAYGVLSEDSIHYDDIIIAFRGSMPPVCRLGLTAFSKIFDFVKNVWFPITQKKQ